MECKVKLLFDNRTLDVNMSQSSSILNGLIKNKIEIYHSCGGNGTCGTCLIEIVGEPFLPLPNDVERELLQDRKCHQNERLSCQNVPLNNLKIRIKEISK